METEGESEDDSEGEEDTIRASREYLRELARRYQEIEDTEGTFAADTYPEGTEGATPERSNTQVEA